MLEVGTLFSLYANFTDGIMGVLRIWSDSRWAKSFLLGPTYGIFLAIWIYARLFLWTFTVYQIYEKPKIGADSLRFGFGYGEHLNNLFIAYLSSLAILNYVWIVPLSRILFAYRSRGATEDTHSKVE